MGNDKVKCPKCYATMEVVGFWGAGFENCTLYQCPKCMKIVFKTEKYG